MDREKAKRCDMLSKERSVGKEDPTYGPRGGKMHKKEGTAHIEDWRLNLQKPELL